MLETQTRSKKKLLRVLDGETLERPPIWLMRQAGRYLPEYRATREKAGGFLDLCYNPDLATEVTLQPIRRFGFDAAILFADILLLPQALGMDLWFETGEGPRLTPIASADELKPASDVHETLAPVYETVRRLSEALPKETALIGFAGAPWTVATYMIAGRGTPDQAPAHEMMRNRPDAFFGIIDRVVDATIEYLCRQADAGAEVVKLFDSWAGSLSGDAFDKACVDANRRVLAGVRERRPHVRVIGFPKGAGQAEAERYVDAIRPDGVAIGQEADRAWAKSALQPKAAVQGNLDPRLMVTGGDELLRATDEILDDFAGGPHIFNLGHGITPDADPRNVEILVRRVQG